MKKLFTILLLLMMTGEVIITAFTRVSTSIAMEAEEIKEKKSTDDKSDKLPPADAHTYAVDVAPCYNTGGFRCALPTPCLDPHIPPPNA